MIREMWGAFPRLLEQNINGLLDQAYPNPTKAFQLYKSCKMEDLWSANFQQFSSALEDFFSKPRAQRKKADFDRHLDQPMPTEHFKSFYLTFRTAHISDEAVDSVASWAHNLMRVSLKTSTAVISLDIITKTLHTLTHPAPFEKEMNFEFEDFCASWKKTVSKFLGLEHTPELNGILKELRELKTEMDFEESKPFIVVSPSIYLTQTELDWVTTVREAAELGLQAPRYPLSKGATKQPLMELERVVQLYEIVRVTKLPELLKHREKTRLTVLARCQEILPPQLAA